MLLPLQIFIEFCAGGAVDDIIVGEYSDNETAYVVDRSESRWLT